MRNWIRKGASLWPAVGALTALLALTGVAASCGGSSGSSVGPQATLAEGATDPRAIGPADAKVMITEYADFQ